MFGAKQAYHRIQCLLLDPAIDRLKSGWSVFLQAITVIKTTQQFCSCLQLVAV